MTQGPFRRLGSRDDRGKGRPALALAASVLVMLVGTGIYPQVVHAHRDVRIGICIPYRKGGRCATDRAAPSYLYGSQVVVKGRIRPHHRGTVEIERRDPGGAWKVVARRSVNDEARYRYVWQTRRKDANQGDPYKFRVHLPGHARSRVRKVFVLFSE